MPKNMWNINIKPINIMGLTNNNSTTKKRRNISHTERAILWERDKRHTCHICMQKIHSQLEAEPDHVKANIKGGQSVRWAHRSCNRYKGKKSLSEVHRRLGIKSTIKRKKAVKKKSTSQHWINPLTGKKEALRPLFKF